MTAVRSRSRRRTVSTEARTRAGLSRARTRPAARPGQWGQPSVGASDYPALLAHSKKLRGDPDIHSDHA